MTKCKECGNEISTKADACPRCGAKQVRTSGCAKLALFAIGFFVFVGVVGQCSLNNSSTSSTSTTAASSTKPDNPPAAAVATPVAGSQWTYGHQDDPMAKGTTYGAFVQSTNTVEFDFPYAGPQHATLTLRNHPRHGKDVYIRIERGQFLCRSYEDCNVLVRFDDEKAQTFSGVGSGDGSTETVFLRNYSRFVSKMAKAKTVRISTEIYQQGSPVFEFDVTGFDQSRYAAGE